MSTLRTGSYLGCGRGVAFAMLSHLFAGPAFIDGLSKDRLPFIAVLDGSRFPMVTP